MKNYLYKVMSENIWDLYNTIEKSFEENILENKEKTIEENILKNNDNIKKCINCKYSSNFKIVDGYYWCNECGENNGLDIIESAEWRYYGSEDSKMSDPTRCGGSTNNLLYNMSCGTMISSKGNSPEVKRLRTIHNL